MPERTPTQRPLSLLKDRLNRVLGIPRRHPRQTRLVFRDALLVAIGVFLIFEIVLWDSLVADMSARVLPDALISTNVLSGVTGLDVVLFEASVGAVVGALAGLARVGVYSWRWRRQRGVLPDRWTQASKISGLLIGGGTLFVAVTVGAYLFVLPVLADAMVVDGVLEYASPTNPFVWTILAVILCLSGGVAALFAYSMGMLSATGIAAGRSVVAVGTMIAVVGLAWGFLVWPLGMAGQMVWAGPLLLGYTAGSVVALVGSRMGSISEPHRSASK